MLPPSYTLLNKEELLPESILDHIIDKSNCVIDYNTKNGINGGYVGEMMVKRNKSIRILSYNISRNTILNIKNTYTVIKLNKKATYFDNFDSMIEESKYYTKLGLVFNGNIDTPDYFKNLENIYLSLSNVSIIAGLYVNLNNDRYYDNELITFCKHHEKEFNIVSYGNKIGYYIELDA